MLFSSLISVKHSKKCYGWEKLDSSAFRRHRVHFYLKRQIEGPKVPTISTNFTPQSLLNPRNLRNHPCGQVSIEQNHCKPLHGEPKRPSCFHPAGVLKKTPIRHSILWGFERSERSRRPINFIFEVNAFLLNQLLSEFFIVDLNAWVASGGFHREGKNLANEWFVYSGCWRSRWAHKLGMCIRSNNFFGMKTTRFFYASSTRTPTEH